RFPTRPPVFPPGNDEARMTDDEKGRRRAPLHSSFDIRHSSFKPPGLPSMTVSSILAPGGAISRRLSNYEPRPQQLEMAEAVEAALDGPHHLLVEAGTGVGKSFAYLVPAILHAAKQKDFKVVVSTHTISLQEQLVHKDIPF